MATLSVCIIVKNEHEFLPICLNSINGLADELIIVDTGSTDKTRDIAKQYSAKVRDFKWVNDFSKARNFSIQQATGEWIFVIDADETINPGDIPKIKKLLEKQGIEGYKLHQWNYTFDKTRADFIYIPNPDSFTKQYPGFILATPVRLFRNQGYRYQFAIHETIESSILERNGKIVDSGIIIHHYGFEKSINSKEEKKDMYFKIAEQQATTTPDKAKPHYESGLIHKSKGRFDQATKCFEHAIAADPHYLHPYSNLAEIALLNNNTDKAEVYLKKAILVRPAPSDHYNLGLLKVKKQEYSLAVHHLLEAIRMQPSDIRFYETLSSLFVKQSKPEKAIKLLEIGRKNNPLDRSFLHLSGLLHFTFGRVEQAAGFFEKGLEALATKDELRLKLTLNLASCMEKLKQYGEAKQLYERIKHEFPAQKGLIERKIQEIIKNPKQLPKAG